jgi:hypothetical protein
VGEREAGGGHRLGRYARPEGIPMMAPLRPCPCCSRHVRVSEPACPFCSRKLDDAFRWVAIPRAPTARLSRAALFALGAGGLVFPACSSASNAPVPEDAAYDDVSVVPLYGFTPFCPDGEALGSGDRCIAAEASVKDATDRAPDAAATDAASDRAGDVQAPQNDAPADAADSGDAARD